MAGIRQPLALQGALIDRTDPACAGCTPYWKFKVSCHDLVHHWSLMVYGFGRGGFLPMIRRLYSRWPTVMFVSVLLLFPLSVGAQESPPEISLEEAIQLSLERSPVMIAANGALKNAHATLLQTRGGWFPSITANSSYSNSSNQRFDQATGRLLSESYTAQLQGSLDIFTGGRRLAQNVSAQASVQSTEADNRASRFQTMLTTTRTFYSAAAAVDLLAAAEARLTRAQQQLSFARTRLEVGTVTHSDVLRARLEEGNAQMAALDARTSMDQALLQLGRQVGVDGRVRPEQSALPEQAPPLPPIDELIERALSGAPSVVAAQADVRSRHADRLVTLTPYLPSLRLSGGYDWFAFTWPPDQRSWSLRMVASLPILNGFAREASLQRAIEAERIARARERDALLAARAAAESSAMEVTAAGQRVKLSNQSVELAREDLRVQEERYTLGVSTILDLQASQIALADAEAASIHARQALGTAIAQLESVLGVRITAEGIQ
jgi:outer membrane protein